MTDFKHSGERGSVLPMIGLTMAVIIGFGAAAVDVGSLDYQWERQQNAADSAALSAARQLLNGTCPAPSPQTNVENAALADATNNGFSGSGVTVVAQNPPVAGPYSVAGGESAAGANCSVAVTISVPNTAAYFMRWFGNPTGVPETTTAVAQMQNTNPGCIYLLNPTTQSSFSGKTFNAASCGILINDNANFSSATVTAKQIGWATGSNNTSGASFPSAQPTPMLETQDPCAEIAGCYAMQQAPPSTASCSAYTGTNPAPNQCYSSLTLTGNTTLSAGTYTLTGGITLPAGGNTISLNGTGVTFYVAPGDPSPPSFTLFSGGSLTPPTTGSYAGVLYWQDPSNANSPTFGGNGPTVGGLIYAPGANSVTYNGTANQPVVLVFGAANFSGANTTIPTPGPSATGVVNQVVLVE